MRGGEVFGAGEGEVCDEDVVVEGEEALSQGVA